MPNFPPGFVPPVPGFTPGGAPGVMPAGPGLHAQQSPQMPPGGPRDPRQAPGVLYVDSAGHSIRRVDFSAYTQIPAIYTINITLPQEADSRQRGSVNLRPELFLLKRITWASNNEDPIAAGRSVSVLWSDEFTSFMGRNPAILPALLGDSQGFLDLTREVLFAGKQTLSAELTRIVAFGEEPARFDLVFHGTGLLPPGMHESGSL